MATAGEGALAAKGVRIDKSSVAGRGMQLYLLRSAGFRDDLAYILYIVPDPTSAQTNFTGGQTFTRNIYAVAVVAGDGTVLYAEPLAS